MDDKNTGVATSPRPESGLREFSMGELPSKIGCLHDWRVIENFYNELSRDKREYIVYCTHCLDARLLTIDKNKK